MNRTIATYLAGVIILAVSVWAGLLVMSLLYDFDLPSVTFGIILFLLLSTAAVHLAFMFSSRQQGETSVSLLMASILGHMVVNIIFILLLLYFNQQDAFSITFIFFGSFVLFMAYELVMITLYINAKRSE